MRTPFEGEDDQWPPDYVSIFQWRQSKLLEMRAYPKLLLGAREYYRTRPVEFICHWMNTYDPRNAGRGLTTLPFILFNRQRELVEFLFECLQDEEDGLIEKARDMGATWVAVAFSVWLWVFWEGSAIGWGSRKEQLVDRIGDPDSIFEKIRQAIASLPREFVPSGYDRSKHAGYMRIVNPSNGATITGEAGDNIGRGGRKLIYFKDESAHYARPQLIEAALSDNTRVQIDISSVVGGTLFHQKRDAGIDWKKGEKIARGFTRVFVMDWRAHPAKDDLWYSLRRAKAEGDGLLHVFEQEVNRNYSAGVEGIIIPGAWVQSAIDAHEMLGFDSSGQWIVGLDVADGGGDTNAMVSRRGPVVRYLDEWGGIDVGATTRKAIGLCKERNIKPVSLQYDSIGVGAGVRSEAARLQDDPDFSDLMKWITFQPWAASAKVLEPKGRLNPNDRTSPKHEDLFANLKAQGWWMVRRRFELTHRAVTNGEKFDPAHLISIPSDLPHVNKLVKELSQPTRGYHSQTLKMVVNKKPEGAKSPNLADGLVEAFWPIYRPAQGLI